MSNIYNQVFAVFAGAALSIGAANVAAAADLRVKAPPPPVVVPAPASWTGCYVGGHAGYSWSRWTDNSLPRAVALDNIRGTGAGPGDPIVFGYDGKYSSDGFAGGVQIGCDKQFGSFVFGVVTDFTWTDQKKTSAPFQIVPTPPTVFSNPETGSVDLKYFGTARGRVGYLFTPDSLIYATGGLAWARASMSVQGAAFTPGSGQVPFAVSDTANFIGWTAGVGGEWRFMPNWTVGLEYLHLDFGSANYRFGTAFPNVTTTMALSVGTNVSLRSDIVRATLNYRF